MKRIPMFLTTSSIAKEKYGPSYDQIKERLKLEKSDDSDLHFLRNTVMNPFQTSQNIVMQLGKLFRNTVLNCVGKVSAVKVIYCSCLFSNFLCKLNL